MMRRGLLAATTIRAVLDEAAAERITAVIEIHSDVEGLIYVVDGEVYLADLADADLLQDQLAAAGLLTAEQIERHTEPGDDQAYLALALDTDTTIDEVAVARWLFDSTARWLARFEGLLGGEYEVDPYGAHPAGILASWPIATIYERVQEIGRGATAALPDMAATSRTAADPVDPVDDGAVPGAAAAPDTPPAPEPAAPAASASSSEPGSVPDPTVVPASSPQTGDTDEAADARRPADGALIVTPDTAPADMGTIVLSHAEWRVVVLAANGLSYADLVDRVGLDRSEVTGLVEGLCARGLLATIG